MAIHVTDVKTFKFYAHKVMPLVYDDSLSYYEFLCKVMAKLNELIESNNEQNDVLEDFENDMQELDEKFEQYKERIDEEIDQMEVKLNQSVAPTAPVLTSVQVGEGLIYQVISLPPVTNHDVGKFARVNELGQWVAEEVPSAEGAEF